MYKSRDHNKSIWQSVSTGKDLLRAETKNCGKHFADFPLRRGNSRRERWRWWPETREQSRSTLIARDWPAPDCSVQQVHQSPSAALPQSDQWRHSRRQRAASWRRSDSFVAGRERTQPPMKKIEYKYIYSHTNKLVNMYKIKIMFKISQTGFLARARRVQIGSKDMLYEEQKYIFKKHKM